MNHYYNEAFKLYRNAKIVYLCSSQNRVGIITVFKQVILKYNSNNIIDSLCNFCNEFPPFR